MIQIRLAKAEWGKAWRAMIDVAPIRLVASDPVYEVLPAHLDQLTARGFSYEIISAQARRHEKPRHGTAN
jgi:hypothetical protein